MSSIIYNPHNLELHAVIGHVDLKGPQGLPCMSSIFHSRYKVRTQANVIMHVNLIGTQGVCVYVLNMHVVS